MKNRQAAIIFVLVTVTLDVLAMGLIIPVLPKLILDFLGGKMTDAANWNGWFALVFALMQFVFSPLLGVLSDRFGRRPVILLSNLGLGLDYVVMALAPTIGWLFLGRKQQPAEFYERVRGAYRELAEREPNRIVLIDGSSDADKVENEMWEVISSRFSALASVAKSRIEDRKSKI
jgi:hypothetical protein